MDYKAMNAAAGLFRCRRIVNILPSGLAGYLFFVGVNPNGTISIAVDGPEHPDESPPLQDGLPSVRLEINECTVWANDGTEID